MTNQSQSGKALEYGIATQLAKQLNAPIIENPSKENARLSFEQANTQEKQKINLATSAIIKFLIAHEASLSVNYNHKIQIQPDRQGKLGDVRDIIIHANNLNIGISAKNRHHAIKHSRLSNTIDFGKLWFGVACSPTYWNKVTPLFEALREKKTKQILWKDLAHKEEKYYLPILTAFRDELKSIYNNPSNKIAHKFLHYLLGEHDFYKIIKENSTISLQSFNINGTLQWGKKIPLPTRIIETTLKPNSKTTIFITFDHGWQVSFRIHNASSKVEPSLRFDIQLIGLARYHSKAQYKIP